MGFNNLVGMLIKRCVDPEPVVLLAISAGVSKGFTALGTSGLLLALILVKSPPRITEVGTLFALS